MVNAQKLIGLPEQLKLFSGSGGGIEAWLNDKTPLEVVARLNAIPENPLTFEHLNQLLIRSHEAGLSRGFFRYYWLTTSIEHPYDITKLSNFGSGFGKQNDQIISVRHLAWGLERLYVDGLLYFGNVRECYRQLRAKSFVELEAFFKARRYDQDRLALRSEMLQLEKIPRDDRYLIAEIACKTYDDETVITNLKSFLKTKLLEKSADKGERKKPTYKSLLGLDVPAEKRVQPEQLKLKLDSAEFSLVEILDDEASNDLSLDEAIDRLLTKFRSARERALRNTDNYLSMVFDLDAYVATSMRSREDFRQMADRCDHIFGDRKVEGYKLRYFDPTLSAASSHEDKGLIECLMVKCCKFLIYMAGAKDSYGKDAEAAMALSLGKPVIFLCDRDTRASFYRDVHPLSRLIDFKTGVAVGAIVTDKETDVPILIDRILSNSMCYEIDKKNGNYLILKERLTGSVVRVQSNNQLLTEAFWNYYHSDSSGLTVVE